MMIIPSGSSLGLSGPALIHAMSFFAAFETKSFSDAVSLISWGEFLQVNGIHIHGIRITGGMWVERKGKEV